MGGVGRRKKEINKEGGMERRERGKERGGGWREERETEKDRREKES